MPPASASKPMKLPARFEFVTVTYCAAVEAVGGGRARRADADIKAVVVVAVRGQARDVQVRDGRAAIGRFGIDIDTVAIDRVVGRDVGERAALVDDRARAVGMGDDVDAVIGGAVEPLTLAQREGPALTWPPVAALAMTPMPK